MCGHSGSGTSLRGACASVGVCVHLSMHVIIVYRLISMFHTVSYVPVYTIKSLNLPVKAHAGDEGSQAEASYAGLFDS